MSAPRKLLNHIDRWLDRGSLHEAVTVSDRPPGGGVPCVVSVALERAVREAHRHDGDARLKHVLAPQGAAADGAARRWEFVFDLPERRAKMMSQWYLDGDAKFGRFGRECFDALLKPFPLPDSPLAQGIAEGKLAYAQRAVAWREERRRTPDLPMNFRDSDAVMADLLAQGLPLKSASFVLRNGIGPSGQPVWLVQLGDTTYHCRFN